MARRILLCWVLLLLTLGSAPAGARFADGGKAKNVVYEGQGRPQTGNGDYRFRIDTSPIIFFLGTVNTRYHVLLIRVKNESDAQLNLSKDSDTIELQFSDGQKVKGIVNLPGADGATWNALETEIRTAVAYPQIVKPREEEGIYLYVRVDDVKAQRKKHEMPSSIAYNIKSLGGPVVLHPPVARAGM